VVEKGHLIQMLIMPLEMGVLEVEHLLQVELQPPQELEILHRLRQVKEITEELPQEELAVVAVAAQMLQEVMAVQILVELVEMERLQASQEVL
jgi:hypothetical protein